MSVRIDRATAERLFREAGEVAPPEPARGKANRCGVFRSELERDYALHLAALKQAGVIADWAYEPVRFLVARVTGEGVREAWYKPDMRITYPDGRREYHEVKGHWREAARIRIKVAAERHPETFVAVTRDRGRWVYERFSAQVAL